MANLMRIHPMAVKPYKLAEGHYLIKNMKTTKVPPHCDEILCCGYAVAYDRSSEAVHIRDIVVEPDLRLEYEYHESLRSGELIKIYVHNNTDENVVVLKDQNIAYMHIMRKTDNGTWVDNKMEDEA